MCGICGIIEKNRDNTTLMTEMLSIIEHRGPDSYSVFSHGDFCLGHRRLSIIDLSTGNQPIFNEDKTVCVVFNGEIYNYKEHKESLQAKGHQFYTTSDTEILVHLYEEYGTEFFSQLNGIFAFALYDIEKDEYLIARDHIGIIPLYVGWDSMGTFYVASELKALEGYCAKIEEFKPGYYLSSKDGKMTVGTSATGWNSTRLKTTRQAFLN